jgi:hypothetical protein
MQQIIDAIAKSSTERIADVKQTQVVLNLSLSFDSLVEVISKLELRELIQLRRSLDQQIDHALTSYTGDDELVLDEIKNHRLISEEVKPLTENSAKEEIIEDFRQAWHEAMTGQTIPVSQLWEEMANV